MTNQEYNRRKASYIEDLIARKFSITINVKSILFDDIETSQKSLTTIFKASDGDLYAVCESHREMTLKDVSEMLHAMNIDVDHMYDPFNDPNYFTLQGYIAFLSMYPGRTTWTDQEEQYYRTMAPLTPALVKIKRVRGELRRFNTVNEKWQKAYDFSYASIPVRFA